MVTCIRVHLTITSNLSGALTCCVKPQRLIAYIRSFLSVRTRPLYRRWAAATKYKKQSPNWYFVYHHYLCIFGGSRSGLVHHIVLSFTRAPGVAASMFFFFQAGFLDSKEIKKTQKTMRLGSGLSGLVYQNTPYICACVPRLLDRDTWF